ncbi:hypothetical protein [Endozoicomonas sp. 8E]|uniref:hypothetical protein n=1 Tax=Endozoicomonas sp. 8E TaxID=3035692 RepID=UPI0029393001|nr:hypothetical protein [Endozoicomonas sp. 8E]WOG27000.1 hypothetical protein P6910_20980 [Endozoicomonas sp. 8E]
MERKDRIIKHSLFSTPLLLLLFLSGIGKAELLTRRFIVEFQQNAGLTNQIFFIKPDRPSLSGIAGTDGYARPYLRPDYIRQWHYCCEIKTTTIESISWQWLYARNLLAAHELILTTRNPLRSPPTYSWLPIEAAIVVGCFLKSYWNNDLSLFNSIEQQKSTSTFTQVRHPFTSSTVMFGSGNDQQPYQQQEQPSESSGQHAPAATDYITSVLHARSGDGNESPQQEQHTLSLNCFVRPCHGVCQFRLSNESMWPAEWSLNCEEDFTAQTGSTPGQSSSPHLVDEDNPEYIIHISSVNAADSQQDLGSKILSEIFDIKVGLNPDQLFQPPAHQSQSHSMDAGLTSAQAVCTIAPSRQKNCDPTLVGEDGQQQPCGKVCKNPQSISSHKASTHNGQQTFLMPVFGEVGLMCPCGRIYKNAKALSAHKSRVHTEPKSCVVSVFGEDGLIHPCGRVCKNAQALSIHKSRDHTGTMFCKASVPGEDGLLRPCGKLYSNAKALSSHKYSYHTGQKTCDLMVIGENGQQQLCGTIFKNKKSLHEHKRRYHSGERTCLTNVVGEDGRQLPCGIICNNSGALSEHKRKHHTAQQTCFETVVGKDGQQRPCGKVCNNAKAFSGHRRVHRKCKPADVEHDDDFTPPKAKKTKQ